MIRRQRDIGDAARARPASPPADAPLSEPKPAERSREARQAEALRANLRRRKGQIAARRGDEDGGR